MTANRRLVYDLFSMNQVRLAELCEEFEFQYLGDYDISEYLGGFLTWIRLQGQVEHVRARVAELKHPNAE
jgi:hypothetical protein